MLQCSKLAERLSPCTKQFPRRNKRPSLKKSD
jgi:hypothetical protein